VLRPRVQGSYYTVHNIKFLPKIMRTRTKIFFFSLFSLCSLYLLSLYQVPHGFTSNLPLLIIHLPHELNRNSDTYVNATLDILRSQTDSNSSLNYYLFPYPFDSSVINRTYNIGIHVRGQSSRSSPKKQFALQILNSSGERAKTGFFDLPPHCTWALYASSADKTLMRNRLAFTLSNLMRRYAPRMHYVELFVVIGNTTDIRYPTHYRGVYMLEEKITRGANSVNIHKMEKSDEGPKTITGGYIFKIDKDEFPKPDDVIFTTNHTGNFYLKYPGYDAVTPAKLAYLEGYLNSFESSLLGEGHTPHYSHYIDVDSFVDTLIIQEFSKNQDAYRLSAYLYKDREDKLISGPLWDMDRTWGNSDRAVVKSISGWLFQATHLLSPQEDRLGLGVPFWWPTFVKDPNFVKKIVERWGYLRTHGNALSDAIILREINAMRSSLAKMGAVQREFDKWGPWWSKLLSWTDFSYHDKLVVGLELWIRERLDWMDSNIYNIASLRVINVM